MRISKVIVGLAVGLLLSVVLSAGMVAASPSVVGNVHEAGDSTKPIVGAEVRATCLADDVEVGPTFSDSAGNYGLDLSATDCVVGNSVRVTGTYEGRSDTNSGEITTIYVSVPLDLAIVCLEIPIPEFTTIAIPAIAVLGLFLFFNKRKQKKD